MAEPVLFDATGVNISLLFLDKQSHCQLFICTVKRQYLPIWFPEYSLSQEITISSISSNISLQCKLPCSLLHLTDFEFPLILCQNVYHYYWFQHRKPLQIQAGLLGSHDHLPWDIQERQKLTHCCLMDLLFLTPHFDSSTALQWNLISDCHLPVFILLVSSLWVQQMDVECCSQV